MSTELRLDAIICHDGKEPEFSSINEKVNAVQKLLDGFLQQGKWSSNNISTPKERRMTSDNRFSRTNRAAPDNNADDKREHGSGSNLGPLLSGTAYCISSCSMILLNKVVLSSYAFNAGISLMFYQNFISCVLVVILNLCGAVSVEKLNWKLIKLWLPVNVIFVGMLVSGMYSLKFINIAMVTIMKNVTNILTAFGELYIFRKRQNQKVWTAMFLMIISAITGGITDLSFDSVGYAWQISNCVLTASYSVYSFCKLTQLDLPTSTQIVCVLTDLLLLTLRQVMDKAKLLTDSGSLNEVSMVLLNNLLSLPFAVILILLFNEWDYVLNTVVIRMPMFWVVATASGVLGLSISFTSMWFLNQTGPTTYSMVGSLNKIPISIAGIMLFKVPVSLPNLFSILFGLFAGVFFAKAKMS